MRRRGLVSGLLLMAARGAWPAADPREAYRVWLRITAGNRARFAAWIAEGTGVQDRIKSEDACGQAVHAFEYFVQHYKQKKPPVPPDCRELDRLLESAIKQGRANAVAALPCAFRPDEYRGNRRLLDSIRAEQRTLDALAREYARVFPGRKDGPSTRTMAPLR